MSASKTIVLVVGVAVIAAGGTWLVGQFRTLPAQPALAARADQRIVTLEVGGMHCTECEHAIATELRKVKGVSTVAARYQQKRAYVVCDKGVADTTLLTAVHAAGPGFFGEVVAK
jgi:copper chaperone CopZ